MDTDEAGHLVFCVRNSDRYGRSVGEFEKADFQSAAGYQPAPQGQRDKLRKLGRTPLVRASRDDLP